ncbi:MAG: PH domain-containing protein [Candidatus Saccharibacteria bacterium]|nr:PH domain-containing protein [Candidatus Saccharibacteria bacterium]
MASNRSIKGLGDVAVDASDNPEPVDQQHSTASISIPEEFLHLFEHDDDEQIIAQALRHPFGVYVIYGTVTLVIVIVMALLGFVVSNPKELLGTEISSSTAGVLAFASILFVSLAVIGGMLSAYVYKKSRLILTSQKLVLIQYHSLFSREVSQLNVVEIEDINVAQPTIVDRLVKTGTITVETAGEQSNYVLSWIKDPFDFSRMTVQVRESAGAAYRGIRK